MKLKMFRLGMKRRDKNLKRMSEIVPNESPALKRELAGQISLTKSRRS
jgi:hypothetical protein